jgi:hypothetical protein
MCRAAEGYYSMGNAEGGKGGIHHGDAIELWWGKGNRAREKVCLVFVGVEKGEGRGHKEKDIAL